MGKASKPLSGWAGLQLMSVVALVSPLLASRATAAMNPASSFAAGDTVRGTDFNGDGKTDIALTGPNGWGSVPVAFSNGSGSFSVTNFAISNFASWAATSGAKVVVGDFNGDGKTDLAITGPSGWASVPVAFSNGNGSFSVTNFAISNFASWAATPGAKVVVGDFNGDGKTDLAITGPSGWASVPVAFSNGNGSFSVTNFAISNFASWAATPGAKVVVGDFNGDGKTDLAVTGPSGWASVPVAFSNGSGSFSVTNFAISNFASWAATPGAEVVVGDFNGDGKTDLAITGPSGWASVPVAFSNGNGSFGVTNFAISNFASWAATPGAKVVVGDFNGDGKTDLAVTGPSGWASVPVAFSNGNGSFGVTNYAISNFASWAATSGAKVVVGDFNGDGKTDFAITGPSGWASVPVAFSNGNGSFGVTNYAISNFASWSATPGAVVVGGTSYFGP